MNTEAKFSKKAVRTLIIAIVSNALFVQSAPNATSEPQINSSEWKPITKPEALSTTEFAERLLASKKQNSTDMEAADTKRSFILVYPPRSSATQQERQKIAPPQTSPRSHGPPLRTYPTQPRYQRMMNFGGVEGPNGRNRTPIVYQRPKFPPVANPPPLPEHALRNRKRLSPNYTPESTSQHQVQIQLLDGYIVPPARGGVSNVHAEKKEPQITTYPLNLNNVPEIRLLLPGDVHRQLNNLRQQPHQQQNRPTNSYPELQGSEGRGRGSQREFPQQTDRNNVYTFESQRRPGRTEHSNSQNNGQNFKIHGSGRPQSTTYNQNTEHRRLNHEFSQPDRAVFPDQVKFPGHNNPNYQDQVNNPVSYNQVKTHPGDVSSSVEVANRNNYHEQHKLDSRPHNAPPKTHGSQQHPDFPRNSPTPRGQGTTHNGQSSPTIEISNRHNFPVQHTIDGRPHDSSPKSHDGTNGQSFSPNFGGHQHPDFPKNSPIPHDQSRTHSGQTSPTIGISDRHNFPGQHTIDGRLHDAPPKSHDGTNGQSFSPNFGGQQHPDFPKNRPIPHDQSRTHSGQTSPTIGISDRHNFPGQHTIDGRPHDAPPKSPDGTTGESFSPNFGGQQHPGVPHTKTHNGQVSPTIGISDRHNFPGRHTIDGSPHEAPPKSHDGATGQSFSPNFGGQTHPDFPKISPIPHDQSRTHSGQASPTIGISDRHNFPGQHSIDGSPHDAPPKSHDRSNGQSVPPSFGGQQHPGVPHTKTHNGQVSPTIGISDRHNFPERHTINGSPHEAPPKSHDGTTGQSFSPNVGGHQHPDFPKNSAIPHDQSRTHSGQASPTIGISDRHNFPGQHSIDDSPHEAPPKSHDGPTGQSFSPSFGGQQHPDFPKNSPIPHDQSRTHSGQASPTIGISDRHNFPGQHSIDGSPHDAPPKSHDGSTGQSVSPSFGGQQHPGVSHTKTHNGQVAPTIGISDQHNFPERHTINGRPHEAPPKSHEGTTGQSFSPSFGGQQHPDFPKNSPIPHDQSRTHSGQASPTIGISDRHNFPGQHSIDGSPHDAPPKSHDRTTGQSVSPSFGGQLHPGVSHTKTHNGQISPTIDVSNRNNFPDQQKLPIRPPGSPNTHSGTGGQHPSQSFGGQSHPDLLRHTPVSHNQVKTHSGEIPSSIEIPNRNRFPEHQRFGSRQHDSPQKSHGTVHAQGVSPNFGGQQSPHHLKRNPENVSNRDSSGPRFQRHEEFENGGFKPLSGNANHNTPNGRNGNTRHDQNNYNDVAGTVHSRHNINANSKRNNQHNNSRNIYSNGWQATHPNRGKPNHRRVPMHPEKINHNSGNPDSQNVHSRGSTRHDFSQFNGDNSPQKSHGTVYNPAGTIHEDVETASVKPGPVHTDRNHRTSTVGVSHPQPGLSDNKVTSPQDQTTEDVYFVPPVLPHDGAQSQIEPFDREVTGDTYVSTNIENPVNTERGDGDIFEKNFERVRNFGGSRGVNGHPDAPFARTAYCECPQNCSPVQRSAEENLGSTIREIARSLDADEFFDFVGLTDEEIENTLAADGSYTLFIPSNEAVSRLPTNLIDHWRENNPDLTLALLNHVVRDQISVDQLKLGGRMTSRANDATIFINNYNNDAVTVNGHRIVYGDIAAPKGGTIHVIDGSLCPVADQDIINTLRTCNKYDGFLTLADVTKLLDTMQDEGPYTVFLPSNEALTKIPPDELAVLKENSTALREFLEYHIVQGVYFSGDLKDGQYLTTLHQRQPIRVGIRVDGCYRRLSEANNSPLFKSDIPTKNGVIHVVDWILRPSDLQWCDGVILP